jgi:hypothetical protein
MGKEAYMEAIEIIVIAGLYCAVARYLTKLFSLDSRTYRKGFPKDVDLLLGEPRSRIYNSISMN